MKMSKIIYKLGDAFNVVVLPQLTFNANIDGILKELTFSNDDIMASFEKFYNWRWIEYGERSISDSLVRKWTLFYNKNKWQYDNVFRALMISYNPLENYDKYSTITNTKRGKELNTNTPSGKQTITHNMNSSVGTNNTSTSVTTNAETTQNKCTSWENITTSTPMNDTIVNGSNNGTITDNGTQTYSGNNSDVTTFDDYKVENELTFDNRSDELVERTHGNIGVTTNAQMGLGEIEFRKYDILGEYVKRFVKENCFYMDDDEVDTYTTTPTPTPTPTPTEVDAYNVTYNDTNVGIELDSLNANVLEHNERLNELSETVGEISDNYVNTTEFNTLESRTDEIDERVGEISDDYVTQAQHTNLRDMILDDTQAINELDGRVEVLENKSSGGVWEHIEKSIPLTGDVVSYTIINGRYPIGKYHLRIWTPTNQPCIDTTFQITATGGNVENIQDTSIKTAWSQQYKYECDFNITSDMGTIKVVIKTHAGGNGVSASIFLASK